MAAVFWIRKMREPTKSMKPNGYITNTLHWETRRKRKVSDSDTSENDDDGEDGGQTALCLPLTTAGS